MKNVEYLLKNDEITEFYSLSFYFVMNIPYLCARFLLEVSVLQNIQHILYVRGRQKPMNLLKTNSTSFHRNE